jgi:hypothetical protein
MLCGPRKSPICLGVRPVEVGGRVAGHVRVVFEVEHTAPSSRCPGERGHPGLCLADSQSVELAQCSTDCARRLGRSRFSSDEPHRSEPAWHGSWHEMTSTVVR